MDTNTETLSKYKLQLRVAINNVRKLESIRSGTIDTLQENEIQAIMLETSEILSQLEKVNTAKVTQIIEKRKRKRQNDKLRHKLIKQQNNLTKSLVANAAHTITSNAIKQKNEETNTERTTLKTMENQKPHQQLRSLRDSNRFLRTFELLELLHSIRVEDDEATHAFSEKLSKLRSIWNVIRQENIPEKHSNIHGIQNQWSTVLFGKQETSFYKRKSSYNDLISIRRKWDSYITKDASSSSIPRGWVLPPKHADPRWECYKTQ